MNQDKQEVICSYSEACEEDDEYKENEDEFEADDFEESKPDGEIELEKVRAGNKTEQPKIATMVA